MIEPLYDRVVVLEDDAETMTKSGLLHIPDTAQVRVTSGVVQAVGTGLITADGTVRPLAVQPDDRVVFRLPSGTRVRVGDVIYLLLRESDIHGILEE
jgi:chaperonin GroES